VSIVISINLKSIECLLRMCPPTLICTATTISWLKSPKQARIVVLNRYPWSCILINSGQIHFRAACKHWTDRSYKDYLQYVQRTMSCFETSRHINYRELIYFKPGSEEEIGHDDARENVFLSHVLLLHDVFSFHEDR